MSAVNDLLAAMDRAGLLFEDALYGAGYEDMEGSHDGGWSIKDTIGHIADWNEHFLSVLGGRPVPETSSGDAKGDSRWSGMSLDDAWSRFDDSRSLLREYLAGVDPSLLDAPLRVLAPGSPLADEATLGEWLRQVTVTHLDEHRPRILEVLAEPFRQATIAGEITRLDSSYARLEAVGEGRLGCEYDRRDEGGWSAADHFLHIAAWNRELVALIRREPVASSVGVAEDVWERGDEAEINEAIHDRNKGASAEAAWAVLQETVRELRAALLTLEDDDLQRPRAEFGSDGRMGALPLIRWVRSCADLHPEGHRAMIERLLGSASAT